ncbi:MAG: hypothetical protein K6T65_10585, partial [Peptococcaceae bacterium]|nr:hypothetical protein [Peptococcaceae bacterium]
MKKVHSDERGGILVMFAFVLVLVFFVAAVAVDYARYVAATEKLQTAVDSASLAAAKTAYRYVKLEIDRGQRYVSC